MSNLWIVLLQETPGSAGGPAVAVVQQQQEAAESSAGLAQQEAVDCR